MLDCGSSRWACHDQPACARALIGAQRELELIFLIQCPGFDAARSEIAGKLSGETMERKHSPWLYQFDVADQIVIIRVIRERKCSVDAVTIDGIWIDSPTADQGHASARDFFQHLRAIRAGWAN